MFSFKKIKPFLLFLFVLVGIEITSRILYVYVIPKFEPLINGKRIVDLMAEGKTTIKSKIVSHPYLLYTNAPNYEAYGYKQTNSLGYRDDEFSLEKPKDKIRILALGGSTTYAFPYVKNPCNTWVNQLEKKLNQNLKKQIEVINAGLDYATSAELLVSYVFKHRFLKPDIVIIHEGGNDVVPLMFPGYKPDYSHFRKHGDFSVRPFEKYLLQLYLVRLFYVGWLHRSQSIYYSQPCLFRDLDRAQVLKNVSGIYNLGFERNLSYLVKMIINDGGEPVLFSFIQQAKKKNLSKNNLEFKGLEDAFEIGLRKNNLIMEKVAKTFMIRFTMPNQELFKEEWFYDNCHLNEKGEKIKANIMYDELVKYNKIIKNELKGF